MQLRTLLPLALLTMTLIAVGPPFAHADNSPIQRIFYLSLSKTLTSTPPAPGLPSTLNFTQTRVEFDLSQQFLFTPATISGSMVFSLYLTSNVTLPGLSISGSFLERLPGQTYPSTNVTSIATHSIDATRLLPLNFTYPIQDQALAYGAQISISMELASHVPRGISVRLYYGSSASPSFITLPLLGYITLDTASGRPVAILDRYLNPVTNFDLNSTDLITIETSVDSMLGFSDISRVNLTLTDPLHHAVRGETNITMTSLLVSQGASPPYLFTASWPYPSNATIGTYQVLFDVFDAQSNRALSFRGPASFQLILKTGSLRITVSSPDGGLQGAAVTLSSGPLGQVLPSRETTDANGSAIFLGLLPGSYTYRVAANGYQSSQNTATVVAGQTSSSTKNLSRIERVNSTTADYTVYVIGSMVGLVIALAVLGLLVIRRSRTRRDSTIPQKKRGVHSLRVKCSLLGPHQVAQRANYCSESE